MRILICLLILCLNLFFVGCKKDMPEPPTEETSNSSGWGATYNEYDITFFITRDPGYGPIYVQMGGYSGNITYYYSYNPGCNASGCANLTVPSGTYSYSASSGPFYRSGTIKTGASQCITINL